MLSRFLLTLLVGSCGGLLGFKAKIPGGGVIGAMLAVTIFGVTTDLAFFPWQIRILTQGVAGAFLASPMTIERIRSLRLVIKPAIIVVSSMLLFSIGIALICFNFTSMDHTTAFFASAPGGITDIVLISTETDANPLQISLIHSSRLFFALVFLPILSKHITSIIEKKWPILCASREKRKDSSISIIESTKKSGINVFFSLTVAVCGALTGFFLGIPAGTLVFSMVFTCIFNLTTKRAYIPIKLRKATQIFAGSIIGSSITMGNIMEISSVILPLIIILSGLIIMNLGIGILIFFLCKLDIRTALFSTIPAGATEMALIVDDLDGDGPKVALIQTFRLISVISIFPQVYFFIIRTFLT